MAKGNPYMRGGNGGMDMSKLMKQAQQMQAQLEQAQDNLKDLEVTSSAGGGMVKVAATGDMRISSITIDPEAIDPEDVELLQDMILAAINGALESAENAASQKMSAATGLGGMSGLGDLASSLGMPGLF